MSNEKAIIPLALLKKTLEKIVHAYAQLLNFIEEELEKHPGVDAVGRLVQAMKDEGIEGWATLYLDPANQLKAIWLSALPPSKANEMFSAIGAMTPQEQSAWISRLHEEGEQAISSVMNMEPDEILAVWPEVADSEIDAKWLSLRNGCVVASLLNTLAAMQTGKSMYQLVAEALQGSDESYFKAVQMDKTVLDFIPYFKERNHRAADEGDIPFLRRLTEYRNKPITITRFQYTKLWLVFDTLDNMNILDQFEQDLKGFAELCQNLRVYGPHPDVEAVDVEDFESRLKDYKKSRKQLLSRTASSILVKDVSSSNSPP